MTSRHFRKSRVLATLAAPLVLAACATVGSGVPAAALMPALTYADLAKLVEDAALVARARIVDQRTVEPERAPGLAPGHARLYVEAQTESLLTGRSGLGESVRYVVDVPLSPNGKVPRLEKSSVLLFANPVPGRMGELQLVVPGAQLAADPQTESRVRSIITEFVAPNAPPRITGIRDVISVPGNLAGESETQMFLETRSGDPVSLTIVRRPGMAPQWGISWSEVVDQSARAPQPNTLEWYRLACSLPASLPQDAYLQTDPQSRARAAADYQFVLEGLGPCE